MHSPSRSLHLRPLELQLRFPDIYERPEFVNIGIAVVEKRVEGMNVQRCGRSLCAKRFGGIEKVVVAINEDARGFGREDFGQVRFGDLGEAQVLRSFNVELLELVIAAGIK